MNKSFRKYTVIETEGMSAEKLQELLSEATDGFPEKQIDHVVGTKIILGHESLLNEKGRAEMRIETSIKKMGSSLRGAVSEGVKKA